MDTRTLKLASLMLATALAGLASPATAGPRPSLNVVLHMCDDPGIQASLVGRAQAEMTRIYRDVGVDIAWITDAATTSGDDGPEASSDGLLTLVILCRELTDELTVYTTALAASVGTREFRGRIAYVFYDRFERFAPTHLTISRDGETDSLSVVS